MNEAEHLVETQRWLRYAREDLEGAETLLAQRVVVPRHICWLSQQSVEKAIKAILVFLGSIFPGVTILMRCVISYPTTGR
jgi:HEPN domain-containing protein